MWSRSCNSHLIKNKIKYKLKKAQKTNKNKLSIFLLLLHCTNQVTVNKSNDFFCKAAPVKDKLLELLKQHLNLEQKRHIFQYSVFSSIFLLSHVEAGVGGDVSCS